MESAMGKSLEIMKMTHNSHRAVSLERDSIDVMTGASSVLRTVRTVQ